MLSFRLQRTGRAYCTERRRLDWSRGTDAGGRFGSHTTSNVGWSRDVTRGEEAAAEPTESELFDAAGIAETFEIYHAPGHCFAFTVGYTIDYTDPGWQDQQLDDPVTPQVLCPAFGPPPPSRPPLPPVALAPPSPPCVSPPPPPPSPGPRQPRRTRQRPDTDESLEGDYLYDGGEGEPAAAAGSGGGGGMRGRVADAPPAPPYVTPFQISEAEASRLVRQGEAPPRTAAAAAATAAGRTAAPEDANAGATEAALRAPPLRGILALLLLACAGYAGWRFRGGCESVNGGGEGGGGKPAKPRRRRKQGKQFVTVGVEEVVLAEGEEEGHDGEEEGEEEGEAVAVQPRAACENGKHAKSTRSKNHRPRQSNALYEEDL